MSTADLTVGLAFIAALATAAAMPWLIHRRRRRKWRVVDAVIERTRYEVSGKNVFALVDVSWQDGEVTRHADRVPTGRIHVEDLASGDLVRVLVNPRNPEYCVLEHYGREG